MTSRKTRRIRELQRSRPEASHQQLWNELRRQGVEAVQALRCDVCAEPLLDGRSQSIVQWLCEREDAAADDGPLRVVALYVHHKGPCNGVVEAVAGRLHLHPLWEEFRAIASPFGDEARGAILELYEWPAGLRRRLARLFHELSIARKRGWALPPTTGWAAKWPARVTVGDLAVRVAAGLAEESLTYRRLQLVAEGQGQSSALEYIATFLAERFAPRTPEQSEAAEGGHGRAE
jgi:hypothetical protein